MTPVAPDRADVEQHGLIFALGGSKGLFAPFMPANGLMHRGAQVRRRSSRQGVARFRRHAPSLKPATAFRLGATISGAAKLMLRGTPHERIRRCLRCS